MNEQQTEQVQGDSAALDEIDAILAGGDITEATDDVAQAEENEYATDDVADDSNTDTGAGDQAADDAAEEPDADGEPEKAKIDYDMEIPLPDGRGAVSLSEMKDAYVDMERRSDALDATSQELMSKAETISAVIDAVGLDRMPEQAVNQLREYQANQLRKENDLLLAAIPEWKHPEVYKKDRGEMVALASEYGYSEADIAATKDHRHVKMLRDFAKLKAKSKAAKESLIVRQKQKIKRNPGRQRSSKDFDSIVSKGTRDERLNLIEDLAQGR